MNLEKLRAWPFYRQGFDVMENRNEIASSDRDTGTRSDPSPEVGPEAKTGVDADTSWKLAPDIGGEKTRHEMQSRASRGGVTAISGGRLYLPPSGL